VGTPSRDHEEDEGGAGEGIGGGKTIFLKKECIMKARVLFFFTVCLLTALTCQVSPVAAAANLVVTSVSGPTEALLNQTISITCTVKNKGDIASEGYEVGLYLSKNQTINPAADRLLRKVSVASGLAPGQVRKRTTKVIIPNPWVNELVGKYYYGAVVEPNGKASPKQVNIVRYKDNGNGTVTDFKTGAMWQKTDDGTEKQWADAISYCDELELADYNDWRLPSIDVLLTIVQYSTFDQAIDPVFVGCRQYYYWSGTTCADDAGGAWNVYFGNGDVDRYIKSREFPVRCVRNGP
jgi:hypothetical protein